MALNIGPVRPSQDTPDEYGPNFSHTPVDDKPKDPPKTAQKNPPKPAESVFKRLGTNKKMRSPVRRLSREPAKDDELSDLERLEGWYHALGNMARPFHPKFAQALQLQATECAVAWFGLAENNDTVRRYILAFIEGGDWGKVFMAHAPIFMAVVPQSVLERFFLKGMGAFVGNLNNADDDTDFSKVFDAMQSTYGEPPQ